MKKIEVDPHELNTLLLCAFRYALGRKSYIVSDIASLICVYRKHLSPHTRERIIKEIFYAFESGDYGMEMDKTIWQELSWHLEKLEDKC